MAKSKKIKILVVDDHSDIVVSISNYLDFNGFQTIKAHNGKMAIEKAKEEKPDLILLDIMMPKVSGFDVCKALPKQKVLFMTAYDDLAEESKQYKNSIGLLRKPIDFEELMEILRKKFNLPEKS